MKTPSPRGKYYYTTSDGCLAVVESKKSGWLWSVSAEDSTPIRVGNFWVSKARALEDVGKALKETGHPTELTQIGASYIYHFDKYTIEVRGRGSRWRWIRGSKQGIEKTKSAALKAAVKGK